MAKQFVQGDILFIRTDEAVPRTGMQSFGRVIARGEKTGHAHVLEGPGNVFNYADRKFVVADGDVTVRHEEHGPLSLEKGMWEVREQKVYDYEAAAKNQRASRRVVD